MDAVYADVIVDINSAALDRVFTYALPDGVEWTMGMRVEVPFGARRVEGYIIALRSNTELAPEKIRQVLRPLEDYGALDASQIELAKYMRAQCKCTLSAALRLTRDLVWLMIPAQDARRAGAGQGQAHGAAEDSRTGAGRGD